MIDLQSVNKIFRTETVETYALRDFTLKVDRGEFVAITGHSGSGKTTLLNLTGLLEEFDGGSYQLEGQDVTRLNDNERSRIRNEKIGFIFQGFNLIPDLSIHDNVEEPLHYRGMASPERERRIVASLDRVGLTARSGHLPSQLSGGQQQRAAIARAIAGDPRVILADEPTGNLDTLTGNEIMALFERLYREGNTIILVTHENDIAQHAHRVVHIRDGKVEKDEPVAH
jgi:putative ABC transport system ATP-binding protein